MDTIKLLVHGAVDYAGLFPPASLPLAETVINYQRYLGGPASPMLGRLVVPAKQLEALAQQVDALPESDEKSAPKWLISALLPPLEKSDDLELWNQAIEAVKRFNANRADHPRQPMLVDSLECKANVEQVTPERLSRVPPACRLFIEVDLSNDLSQQIQKIQQLNQQASHSSLASPQHRLAAKIRTGSVVAEEIPSVAEVAKFISLCAQHRVPFKATAGLHHPLRSEYRLTYEQNPPMGTMHGFVNVFVATLLAFEHSVSFDVLKQVLDEREPANFQFDEKGIGWSEYTVSVARIAVLRADSIQSFGSCSFTEPSEELAELFGQFVG